MTTAHNKIGFTLIELLVVIAIISLLMSILMPSLSRAREQSKIAVCLSNMRQIGLLMQEYAEEDRTNQPIPIHNMMIRPTGCCWLYRTVNSFTWGGRDGQVPLRPNTLGCPAVIWLNSDERGYYPAGMNAPAYGARERPLNRYYLGSDFTARDYQDMPLFRCPSDAGHLPASLAIDVPESAYGIPCYDLFGNSYRANMYGFISDGGALSLSPWGHRTHTLPDPSRLILFAEASFFSMSNPVAALGRQPIDWHGRARQANVLFLDGSARGTPTDISPGLDDETAEAMDLFPGSCNPDLPRYGNGWRIDVWPTLSARIWGDEVGWTSPFPDILDPPIGCRFKREAWPFDCYERNLE